MMVDLDEEDDWATQDELENNDEDRYCKLWTVCVFRFHRLYESSTSFFNSWNVVSQFPYYVVFIILILFGTESLISLDVLYITATLWQVKVH